MPSVAYKGSDCNTGHGCDSTVKINGGSNNQQLFSMGVFENIDSYDKCIAATQQVLQIAKSNDEYDIIMANDMANMLDENYYEPYDKWMEVGWALKTVSPLLYPCWMLFSSKSDKFNWVDNDCFKTSPIKKNSTIKEIKQAYRTLSLQYHPDKND